MVVINMLFANVFIFFLTSSFAHPADKIYSCSNGIVDFVSDAPLEIIKAKT